MCASTPMVPSHGILPAAYPGLQCSIMSISLLSMRLQSIRPRLMSSIINFVSIKYIFLVNNRCHFCIPTFPMAVLLYIQISILRCILRSSSCSNDERVMLFRAPFIERPAIITNPSVPASGNCFCTEQVSEAESFKLEGNWHLPYFWSNHEIFITI